MYQISNKKFKNKSIKIQSEDSPISPNPSAITNKANSPNDKWSQNHYLHFCRPSPDLVKKYHNLNYSTLTFWINSEFLKNRK